MAISEGATHVQGLAECGQTPAEGFPVTIQGCGPGAIPVPVSGTVTITPGACLPVEGCPGGDPVEVTGPGGGPVVIGDGGGSITVDGTVTANQGTAGATPWPVRAVTVAVSGVLTRPANVLAYAAGDAVTDSTTAPSPITFSNCAAANGRGGEIRNIYLIDSSNATTKGSFELWLFDTAPVADNDNTPFTPTDAELATLVAIVVFSSASTVLFVGDATIGASGNAVYVGSAATVSGTSPLSLPGSFTFTCAGSDRNLYGLIVVRNAYTPVSGEQFTIRMQIAQD